MDYLEIMDAQRLLFDGYLRIEIMINLSDAFTKILSNDVINLCYTFFKLEIKSLTHQHLQKLLDRKDNVTEEFALSDLCNILRKQHEFWIAYKILKMLISIRDSAYYQNLLGLTLEDWGKTYLDDAIKAFIARTAALIFILDPY